MTIHTPKFLLESHAMHMNCQVTKAESKVKLIKVLGYDIVCQQFFSLKNCFEYGQYSLLSYITAMET